MPPQEAERRAPQLPDEMPTRAVARVAELASAEREQQSGSSSPAAAGGAASAELDGVVLLGEVCDEERSGASSTAALHGFQSP